MSKKLPAIQFYPADHIKDPNLSMCAPATRGIWMDLLCAMHENNRSGQITGTPQQLSRLCRCTAVEFSDALADLSSTKTANVTERNGIVTVVNRRMHREAKDRENTNLRVQKFRGNGEVTDLKRESNNASSSSVSSSVTNVTGASPADSENGKGKDPVTRRIWNDGVDLLKNSGFQEQDARSLLGKLAKDFGSESLAECIAIGQAKNPVNAEEFLIGTLKARKAAAANGNGKPKGKFLH